MPGQLDHVEIYIYNRATGINIAQDLIFELRGTDAGGAPDPNVSSFGISVTPGQVLAIVLIQAPGDQHTDYSWDGGVGYPGGAFCSINYNVGTSWLLAGNDLGFKTYVLTGGCLTNKTVPCESACSFDVPTAFDACCATNVTISVLDTVTNIIAGQAVITRTWLATDCCSNTATCGQIVTELLPQPVIVSVHVDSAGSHLIFNTETGPIYVVEYTDTLSPPS